MTNKIIHKATIDANGVFSPEIYVFSRPQSLKFNSTLASALESIIVLLRYSPNYYSLVVYSGEQDPKRTIYHAKICPQGQSLNATSKLSRIETLALNESLKKFFGDNGNAAGIDPPINVAISEIQTRKPNHPIHPDLYG